MFLWSYWPNQIRHSQQDLRDDDNNKLLDYKWKPMWFWCWHDSFEYKHAFFRCIFIYVVYQHGTSLNTKRMTTSMMETLIKRNIVMSFFVFIGVSNEVLSIFVKSIVVCISIYVVFRLRITSLAVLIFQMRILPYLNKNII